jgi:His/Glu/Gln/Arg/opine family amino acid ABC transporter permease subunit
MMELFFDAWPIFKSAFETTLILSVFSLSLTAVLCAPVALALKADATWARMYVDVSMKVPLIVKIFICFYALQMNPILCAVIALVIHQVGYTAEVIRGGLLAVPGEYEDAAITMGLSPAKIAVAIKLPISLRLVSPSLVLHAAEIVKNTSIVSLIGVVELTGAAETLQSQTFEYLPGFFIAAVAYASLTLPLMATGYYLEKKMARADS